MTEAQVPTQAAGLFQKAHGKIVMLSRLDSQISNLLGQRQRVQEELSGMQSLINEELHRVMHHSDQVPAKVLAEISVGSRSDDGDSSETVA